MKLVRKSLLAAAAIALAACTEPKSPGVLWVTHSTKLGDELPFSWTLTIDDGAPHTINSAVTASLRFDSLSAGSHRLLVSNAPTGCTTGNDDREIDIPSGDTVRLSIQVVCPRVTGDVAVTVSTNGTDRDLDGYTLLRDGQPIMALPPLTSVTRLVSKLTPGNHIFSLAGVASNCSVANGATTAFVSAGKSVLALLSVDCAPISGNLRVVTTTSGGAALADPSGYLVTVGLTQQVVVANGTTPIAVPAGSYTATLSDIEPNCTAAVTQKSVSIAVGGTSEVTFDVSCGSYAPTTAAFSASDPTVDTLPNQANAPAGSFDLIGLTTRYASNYMTLTLRFSRALGADVMYGYVDFDLDENTSSGVAPFMNTFGGSATQGVEARLSFSTGASPFGIVSTISGNFGQVRTTVDGDSVRFIIPLERLDGDDGNVTITGIIGSPDRPTDLIPNTGVLVSHRSGSAVAVGRQLKNAPLAPRAKTLLLTPPAWVPPQRPR